MLSQGTWYLSSETDPRWNCSGLSLVGMFTKPEELEEKLELLKLKYGELPEDLKWGYIKD